MRDFVNLIGALDLAAGDLLDLGLYGAVGGRADGDRLLDQTCRRSKSHGR